MQEAVQDTIGTQFGSVRVAVERDSGPLFPYYLLGLCSRVLWITCYGQINEVSPFTLSVITHISNICTVKRHAKQVLRY